MPLGNTKGQRLHLLPSNLFVETGDQRAAADGAHGLARDGPGLDGHAEIVSELEQKLVKDIFFTSVRFDVVDTVEKRTFEIVAVRLPGADVGGIELEDAEAEVAGEHRVLVFDLLGGATEAFLGELDDVGFITRPSGSSDLFGSQFSGNCTIIKRRVQPVIRHSTALRNEPLFLSQQKNRG